MNQVFDAYAAYYDLLYKDKNYQEETRFLVDTLQRLNVPSNGALLELGCGTGKHAEILARSGFSVNGVDSSSKMISAANLHKPKDVEARLCFATGDARTISLGQTFDAIISLFHVASYQTTNADLLAMFKTAAKHLDVGGFFLFDCWYGPAVLTDRPVERFKKMQNEEIDIERIAIPVMHPNENLVDVNYSLSVLRKRDGKLEKFTEIHRMRYLFSPEVEFILQTVGMRLKERVEWLTGKETGFHSWTTLFIAEKIEA